MTSCHSRIGTICLAALAAAALGGCAHAPIPHRADVGGHRLNYRCGGKGSPVVVMDSGLGNTLETWDEVAPAIGTFTRVCVYDRAGLGRSEPGPMPRTSRRIVWELRALLAGIGERPPYVLVGHSMGGLNVRLFAAEHPEEAAGLVLVDATHPDYPELEAALRTEAEKRRIEHSMMLAPPAARSEFESLAESVAQVRAAPPLPDVPLVVVTAHRRDDSPELRQVWSRLQADLVRLAPRGRQILAAKSGHNIQFDQPGLIVEAVREVVEEARKGTTTESEAAD